MLHRIKKYFNEIYNFLCGKDAYLYLWHFQWLAIYDLHADLKAYMKQIHGKMLDIGCGGKPYSVFLNKDVEHIGLDIIDTPKVDYTYDGLHIPFENEYFDCILCTQVLEHAEQPDILIQEMARCLKSKGIIILTVPFIYNQHGSPHDYRRYSQFGVKQLFQKGFVIDRIIMEGGIGSSAGFMILNWLDIQMSLNNIGKFFKVLLLPIFLMISFMVNIAGFLIDKLDKTNSFYNNVMIIANKELEITEDF